MSFLRRKRRGKPRDAPAAEAAPPSPPNASPTRDGYGFVVKPAFADAYKEHVPMFVREEEERRERWMAFLERASYPTSPVAAGHTSAGSDARDARSRGAPAVLASSGTGLDAVEEILRNRDRGACSADAPRRERELESLVRGGVPMALRGELWQLCLRVDEVRVPGAYDSLVALVNDDAKDATAESSRTKTPSSEARSSPVSSTKKTSLSRHTREQIAKDVPRTFPGHAQLDSPPMRSALERVLRAFALAHPAIGYCQGMNFITGVFLLLMEEEAAFWALKQVLDVILPEYFSIKGKMKTHLVDQEVLRELAENKTPALVQTLDENGCPLHAVASSWFMALFANALPWETALRVWDVTLFERTRATLFQTALAVMELDQMTVRKASRAQSFPGGAFEAATTMASRAFDASRLVMHATCGHADVTWRVLKALFAKHAKRMEREGRFDDDESKASFEVLKTEEEASPRSANSAIASSANATSSDSRMITHRDPTLVDTGRADTARVSAYDSKAGWRTPGVPAPATRAKVVNSPASFGAGASRGNRSSERRWRDVLAKGARGDDKDEKVSAAGDTKDARRKTLSTPKTRDERDLEDMSSTRLLPEDEEKNHGESRGSARRAVPMDESRRASEKTSSLNSDAKVRIESLELEVARLKQKLELACRRADDLEKASSSQSLTLKTTLEALADRDRVIARLSAQTKEQAAMLRLRDAETIERHRARLAFGPRKTVTLVESSSVSSAPSAS